MKVFGYARRSSSEKSKSNYSIESQKRVCNELAARDNRTIENGILMKDIPEQP